MSRGKGKGKHKAAEAAASEASSDQAVVHAPADEAPGTPVEAVDTSLEALDGEPEPTAVSAAVDEGAPGDETVDDHAADAAALDAMLADDGPTDGPAPMVVSAELKSIVEALIFASPEPLALKALRKLLDGEAPETIEAAVAAVRSDYETQARGLQLVEVAGGYQIVTRSELHEWVRRLFHERTTQKLSVQALETLAVIAYKQPVTAAEITEIRGVNSSGVLGTLVDRHLIKIAGRKQVVGRPFMYATTREFLDRFGLRDLSELPKIEDMADALGFEPPSLQDTANVALPFEAADETTGGDSATDAESLDAGTIAGPIPDDEA